MLNELKEKLGSDVQTQVSLKDLTSIKIGGEAQYFFRAMNLNALIEAINACQELGISYFVLGGGNNLIISDNGIKGLVIKNEASEISFEGKEVVADSGISLSLLIRKLAELDLGGLEFLTGIPGTLGGAVVNNAGAFGDEISNHIKTVIIIDEAGEVKTIPGSALEFSYRNSLLKSKKKDCVILRVRLKMRKGKREEIMRKLNNFLRLRSSQPRGHSCGSFFKNPYIKNPRPEWEGIIKNNRVPAGYLLELAGVKGMSEGGVGVSSDHANWIINRRKRGSAAEVKKLADTMKEMVKKKYAIELEEEAEYVGF